MLLIYHGCCRQTQNYDRLIQTQVAGFDEQEISDARTIAFPVAASLITSRYYLYSTSLQFRLLILPVKLLADTLKMQAAPAHALCCFVPASIPNGRMGHDMCMHACFVHLCLHFHFHVY